MLNIDEELEPHQALANAIIQTAAIDWRHAAKKLLKEPENKKAMELLQDCESFFCSDWFMVLTNLNGPQLLRDLKKDLREKLLVDALKKQEEESKHDS